MLFGKYPAYAAVGLLAFASLPASADTLATNTAGKLNATTAPGQSITMPGGGPFGNLIFNWYDTNITPVAAGTLYVLDQEYTGKAGDLSSTTPGFLGASQTIEDNQYKFDPTFTLQGATQYFFYTNASLTFSGQGNSYAGGNLYLPVNNNINNNIISLPRLDADFWLGRPGTINPVPEPSTVAFLAASALAGAAFLRRRKQAHNAA